MNDVVVNEEVVTFDVPARTTLLDALRGIGLTGAHSGCEHGACGACTVLLDGDPIRSCLLLVGQCGGHDVTTVEGLGFTPLMEAFRRCHGLQCGFCTPGMVLTATALLRENPRPTDAEVREAIGGNVCRCTGYAGIVAAVLEAAG
jgi:carbon-monoxide dehydrogenase small subunit